MSDEFKIGDYVTLRLKVTGTRPRVDKQTGQVVGQILELGREIGPGIEFLEHYLVCPAEHVRMAPSPVSSASV